MIAWANNGGVWRKIAVCFCLITLPTWVICGASLYIAAR